MPTEESFKNKKMILLIKIRYKKYSILQIYHRFALEMQFFGFFFVCVFLNFILFLKKILHVALANSTNHCIYILYSFLRKPWFCLLQDLNIDTAVDHTHPLSPKHYLVLFIQLRILILNDQALCKDQLGTMDDICSWPTAQNYTAV